MRAATLIRERCFSMLRGIQACLGGGDAQARAAYERMRPLFDMLKGVGPLLGLDADPAAAGVPAGCGRMDDDGWQAAMAMGRVARRKDAVTCAAVLAEMERRTALRKPEEGRFCPGRVFSEADDAELPADKTRQPEDRPCCHNCRNRMSAAAFYQAGVDAVLLAKYPELKHICFACMCKSGKLQAMPKRAQDLQCLRIQAGTGCTGWRKATDFPQSTLAILQHGFCWECSPCMTERKRKREEAGVTNKEKERKLRVSWAESSVGSRLCIDCCLP